MNEINRYLPELYDYPLSKRTIYDISEISYRGGSLYKDDGIIEIKHIPSKRIEQKFLCFKRPSKFIPEHLQLKYKDNEIVNIAYIQYHNLENFDLNKYFNDTENKIFLKDELGYSYPLIYNTTTNKIFKMPYLNLRYKSGVQERFYFIFEGRAKDLYQRLTCEFNLNNFITISKEDFINNVYKINN